MTENYSTRHNGPSNEDISQMLEVIGVDSLNTLIDNIVPDIIRLKKPLRLPKAMNEYEYLEHLRALGAMNKPKRSFIGQGYYGVSPLSVITRNVLENPAWYTSYTPYQAEISQGRLEALLTFQTMIVDLTAMEIANASLLDEATAAAEAMIMMFNSRSHAAVKAGANNFFVDKDIFKQTMDLIYTRSEPLGIHVVVGDYEQFVPDESFFGALVQYPAASGTIRDYASFADRIHAKGGLLGVAADLMSLAFLVPPGEWGADIVLGSGQRFGLNMAFGGPHAGYFATKENLKRQMPGRIVGVSIDADGNRALRLALQTREQHIKRERATSNICTAQALLAVMSGMYAQYHGKEGLKKISSEIHHMACTLNAELKMLGYKQLNDCFFDTLKISFPNAAAHDYFMKNRDSFEFNFYYPGDGTVMISIDEVTTLEEINKILSIFAKAVDKTHAEIHTLNETDCLDTQYLRKSDFLTADIFNAYHSETGMMRYIKSLEVKDFSLANGMIPLGSCTMKLNSATSMFALSRLEFGNIHPFVPKDQALGYYKLMDELSDALKEITGFTAVSYQPNSGAAGEYAGLMTIRAYHHSRGDNNRNVVIIPASAHGTNPASAAMAGMKVVVVNCDDRGNIDVDDLRVKVEQHKDNIAAMMVTYPSTHGVYEASIVEIVDIIHSCGGLVYMDGANMNGQVGLTSPGYIGADACHLNLHKTFAMPHGGGGPGEGPILVNDKLAEFLPAHPLVETGGCHGITAVAAAPFGSAQLLPIAHAYIYMMGGEGLTQATRCAMLNANYISSALKGYYDTLYLGDNGYVAHEMIADCRKFKTEAGVSETDIAKRLMDYGFHAPTLSFPVHGTLMIEPTESEPLAELNRFIEAMKSIRAEIDEIKEGLADKEDNVLRNAPHTAAAVSANEWNHKYDREKAAYPVNSLKNNKFWPSTRRVNDGYGDRNLVCVHKDAE